MIGGGTPLVTPERRSEVLQAYAWKWDAFVLSVTPERCENLTAPLSPEGRLPGAIQLSNKRKV